jgi:hypothetical protein
VLAPLTALEVGAVVAAGVVSAGALVGAAVTAGALVSLGAVVGATKVGTGGIVGLVQAAIATVSNSNDIQLAYLVIFI